MTMSQIQICSNPNVVPTTRPAAALRDHDVGSPVFKIEKIRQQQLE